MTAPVVRTADLRKSYGEVVALDGIDLEVGEGEVFGLLGPNGAGKTTTVKTLVTLVRPDGGAAWVLGHDVAAEPARVRARIGYVPQELTADRSLTAREHLACFCDLYHLPRRDQAGRVAELLALVGLEAVADRRLGTFSGGMKKKLDVACGLVHRPRLLFLDEPTLGLDVQSRRAVWDHVRELRRGGTSVFLCTNDMEEADRLADRIAIVDRGRVAALGTPAELRAGLGGDVVSVELVDATGLDRAEGALRSLPLVRGTFRDETSLHVTVEANETALPALLEALRGAGAAVRAASYYRPGLDEVFLRHTGHRFPATSAPPPAAARR